MSTFFEKLTGSRSKNSAANQAPADFEQPEKEEEDKKYEPNGVPRKTGVKSKEPAEGARLKIAEEEKSVSPAEERTEEAEEEGELAVDIYDKGDEFIIQSTVSGVKPEDIDVSITNESVTIRGRRENADKVDEKNYYYRELFWGAFSRSVILPEEIEEDEAEAVLKYGLLTVRLPKKKRGISQKLKIKAT